jgi:hypothetical protein
MIIDMFYANVMAALLTILVSKLDPIISIIMGWISSIKLHKATKPTAEIIVSSTITSLTDDILSVATNEYCAIMHRLNILGVNLGRIRQMPQSRYHRVYDNDTSAFNYIIENNNEYKIPDKDIWISSDNERVTNDKETRLYVNIQVKSYSLTVPELKLEIGQWVIEYTNALKSYKPDGHIYHFAPEGEPDDEARSKEILYSRRIQENHLKLWTIYFLLIKMN